MQGIVPRLTVSALLSLLLGSTALAQGGGFVFDAPEPPRSEEPPAVVADEPPAETGEVKDDLADFSFGGAADTPDDAPASDAERAAWADADTAGAAEGFRAYLAAYPDGTYAAEARKALADLQAAADRRQGLVTACDRMAGDPADPGLEGGAGGVAMDAIDVDAALWTCSRALAAAPDLPRLSYNMGRIAEAQGQPRVALDSYRTALQQGIDATGNPYLPAAAGILRLSEPHNASERMSHKLLRLAIDGAARIEALQARGAELDEALAVATAEAADAAARTATLTAKIEAMTAREMELSSALAEAEADGERAGSLAGEVAALSAELEAMTARDAALTAQIDSMTAREAELTAELAAAEAEAVRAESLDAEVAALAQRVEELRARLAATESEATAAAGQAASAAEQVESLKAEVLRLNSENAALQSAAGAAGGTGAD